MRGELWIERLRMSRKNDRRQLDVVAISLKTCHDLVCGPALILLREGSGIKDSYRNRPALKARHQPAEIQRGSPSIAPCHQLGCSSGVRREFISDDARPVFSGKLEPKTSPNEIAKTEILAHHLNTIGSHPNQFFDIKH